MWARRAEAARELAEANGTQAVGSLEELWERCEVLTMLCGPSGSLAFRRATDPPSAAADLVEAGATLRREFAAAVTSGIPSALDVNRGVRLQRLIDAAARSLG